MTGISLLRTPHVEGEQADLKDDERPGLPAELVNVEGEQADLKDDERPGACQPQTAHRMLLPMNHQKPQLRRLLLCDATSQAATSVAIMAGH